MLFFYHTKMKCILFLLFLTLPLFLPLSTQATQIDLTHINQLTNVTESALIRSMVRRSRNRLTSLLSKLARNPSNSPANSVQSQLEYGNYEYLMELYIGTPPLRYSAILDTGSDLIWTQCQPCVMCFAQPSPLFNPSRSSTYTQLSCSDVFCKELHGLNGNHSNHCSTCRYIYAYAGDAYTEGMLSSETFMIGNSLLANLSFGCGDTNYGDVLSQAAGIVGMGRGSFSLATQLGVNKFSYCLSSPLTKSKSVLTLGSKAQITKPGARIITMAPNPSDENTFYRITLKGIRVGYTSVQIPNHLHVMVNSSVDTGNMIIDSGTAITYVEQAMFDMVVAAFVSQMDLPIGDGSSVGLDLCFVLNSNENIDTVHIPDMVFQFEGDDLKLDRANYFALERSTNQMCLMMGASNGLSIFGNFQQQNTEVLYDLKAETISFSKTNCGEKVK